MAILTPVVANSGQASQSMPLVPVGWPLMQVPGSGVITNNATEETTGANAAAIAAAETQAGITGDSVL